MGKRKTNTNKNIVQQGLLTIDVTTIIKPL